MQTRAKRSPESASVSLSNGRDVEILSTATELPPPQEPNGGSRSLKWGQDVTGCNAATGRRLHAQTHAAGSLTLPLCPRFRGTLGARCPPASTSRRWFLQEPPSTRTAREVRYGDVCKNGARNAQHHVMQEALRELNVPNATTPIFSDSFWPPLHNYGLHPDIFGL